MYVDNGWARKITEKEALEIVSLSEKDGLVIELSNEQEPSFACMCCSCCCGIFEMLAALPRPADFVESNFYAVVDKDSCTGCGKCVKRCNTNAIIIKNKKAILNRGKCIGCGLCVATCKPGAVALMMKKQETTPPKDYDDLMDQIMKNKKGKLGQIAMVAKGMARIKV